MSTPTSRGGFWLTNHVANPILRPLLRSRVGCGWAVAQPWFATAVAAPAGSTSWLSSTCATATWCGSCRASPSANNGWRNMLDASPIDIWLAGHHLAGVARIVNEANDHETVAAALTRYRVAFPRVTHTSVVVRVDVSPTPGPGEATQEPWDLGTTDVDTGAGSS